MTGSCKELRVWKQAIALALEIHQQTQDFPKQELYGFTNQLRRASVSVASNIAEGKGRSSDKVLILFLHYARGSLLEAETQLLISRGLGYLDKNAASNLMRLTEESAKALNALIKALRDVKETSRRGESLEPAV